MHLPHDDSFRLDAKVKHLCQCNSKGSCNGLTVKTQKLGQEPKTRLDVFQGGLASQHWTETKNLCFDRDASMLRGGRV